VKRVERTLAGALNDVSDPDGLTIQEILFGPLTEAFIIEVLEMRHDRAVSDRAVSVYYWRDSALRNFPKG